MNNRNWSDILPANGVMGILGKRRQGKSALAYHVAELRHQLLDKPAVVLGPPPQMASKFPDWVAIITDLQEFAKYPGHTAILDEGSLSMHARESLARDHTAFDQVFSLCGQRDQLFVFNTHHSRKLDPLMVMEYELLAYKLPGKMQTRMDRREIRQWSTTARERLLKVPEAERKAWSWVLWDDLEEEALLTNPLPSFWCDEISKAVSIAMQGEERGEVTLNELDTLRSAFYRASLPVWDSLPELRDDLVGCADLLKPVVNMEAPWDPAIGPELAARLRTCMEAYPWDKSLAGLYRQAQGLTDRRVLTPR